MKIGYVTPVTGPLAFFAEADGYVLPQFRQAMANGINIGGTTYDVELIAKDSQSNPNRVSEVASDLILAAHTPETVNPVSDIAEINEVPCLTTDASWQSWFFPRYGDPAKRFTRGKFEARTVDDGRRAEIPGNVRKTQNARHAGRFLLAPICMTAPSPGNRRFGRRG